jgi:hypothetical protein
MPQPSDIAPAGSHAADALERLAAGSIDVAIWCAAADIPIAELLTQSLRADGYRVFVYQFAGAEMWGVHLERVLPRIFAERATVCVVLLSKAFCEGEGKRRDIIDALQSRANNAGSDFLVAIRLNEGCDIQVPKVTYEAAARTGQCGLHTQADRQPHLVPLAPADAEAASAAEYAPARRRLYRGVVVG